MPSEPRSKGELMREYNRRLASVTAGLRQEDVRAILGEPTAITSRAEISAPSDFFRGIGSDFRFPDDETDLVWIFSDPYRPRVSHYVGFSAGRVRAIWKETLTEERWNEINE